MTAALKYHAVLALRKVVMSIGIARHLVDLKVGQRLAA
jgi:hypothetical protein